MLSHFANDIRHTVNYVKMMDDRMRSRIEALQRAMSLLEKQQEHTDLVQQLIDNVKSGLYEDDDLDEMNAFRINLTQVMLVLYREVKKCDPDAALWLLRSYQEDHPTAPGSNIFNKLMPLLESSVAAKKIGRDGLIGQGNRELAFLSAKEGYRAGMGFLSALMGWMYPLFQVWEDQDHDWKSLKWPDAKKANEFERISKGCDGIFFMLTPLINKHLRNAIAHGDIQLDSKNVKVLYSNTIEGHLVHSEMDLMEFVGLGTYLFSRLPSIYLGVLSTIFIYESGRPDDILRLPAFSVEKISGITL